VVIKYILFWIGARRDADRQVARAQFIQTTWRWSCGAWWGSWRRAVRRCEATPGTSCPSPGTTRSSPPSVVSCLQTTQTQQWGLEIHWWERDWWQWHLTSEHLPVGDVDAADVGEGERRRHRPDDVLGGHEWLNATSNKVLTSCQIKCIAFSIFMSREKYQKTNDSIAKNKIRSRYCAW